MSISKSERSGPLRQAWSGQAGAGPVETRSRRSPRLSPMRRGTARLWRRTRRSQRRATPDNSASSSGFGETQARTSGYPARSRARTSHPWRQGTSRVPLRSCAPAGRLSTVPRPRPVATSCGKGHEGEDASSRRSSTTLWAPSAATSVNSARVRRVPRLQRMNSSACTRPPSRHSRPQRAGSTQRSDREAGGAGRHVTSCDAPPGTFWITFGKSRTASRQSAPKAAVERRPHDSPRGSSPAEPDPKVRRERRARRARPRPCRDGPCPQGARVANRANTASARRSRC